MEVKKSTDRIIGDISQLRNTAPETVAKYLFMQDDAEVTHLISNRDVLEALIKGIDHLMKRNKKFSRAKELKVVIRRPTTNFVRERTSS